MFMAVLHLFSVATEDDRIVGGYECKLPLSTPSDVSEGWVPLLLGLPGQ